MFVQHESKQAIPTASASQHRPPSRHAAQAGRPLGGPDNQPIAQRLETERLQRSASHAAPQTGPNHVTLTLTP